ncbi:MAG: DUF4956 domain-containing protein [Alphaproteobacteria bacterium]|nr:DUF4956 domain-containing protein [Alphaproteobacteria bacterium]
MIPDALRLTAGMPTTPEDAVPLLVVAFFLGLGTVMLHRFTRAAAPEGLLPALAMLPVVAALVMLVIGNSLASAFTLVGALAIVRFRTAVSSPWDVSMVFLALAAGVGCGVGSAQVAVAGWGIAALGVLGLGAMPATRPPPNAWRLRAQLAAYQCDEARIAPVLERHLARRDLTSAQSLRFGESLALTWRVVFKDEKTLEPLIKELAAVEGVERVSLLPEGVEEG